MEKTTALWTRNQTSMICAQSVEQAVIGQIATMSGLGTVPDNAEGLLRAVGLEILVPVAG